MAIFLVLLHIHRQINESYEALIRSNNDQYKRRKLEEEHRATGMMQNILAVLACNAADDEDRYWVKPQSHEQWELIMDKLDADAFKSTLRVTRETFLYLCGNLRPKIEKTSKSRAVITHTKRVAVTLHFLGHKVKMSELGLKFGLGTSTAHKVVYETIDAIIDVFGKLISFPDEERLKVVMQGFEAKNGMPNICGAIDGTHILIDCPNAKDARSYQNYKGRQSYLVIGVVDHQSRFIDLCAGLPGCNNDAGGLREVTTIKRAISEDIMQVPVIRVNEVALTPYIIADSGFPLRSYLMTPFSRKPRYSKEEHYFNYAHSSTRMIVENTFGMLKNRWACLHDKIDSRNLSVIQGRVPKLIWACCILPNICIDRGKKEPPSFERPWLRLNIRLDLGDRPQAASPTDIRNALMTSMYAKATPAQRAEAEAAAAAETASIR